MKNPFRFLVIVALAAFCSCQKQVTQEEIKAMVKQEVKEQLAAEHEAEQKEREQRRAEFTARTNALFERRKAATNAQAPESQPAKVPVRPSIRDNSANPATTLSPGAVRRPVLPPGLTFPERPFPQGRLERPMPAGSVPEISESSTVPATTPTDSAAPSLSPLPGASDSLSPTATPESSDTAPQ